MLQGIAAGIGTSNFLRAAFIVSLSSSSFRSIKIFPSQLSGIVELWFLDRPSLFRFLFRCIGHKFPHIWPHIVRTRSFFCFLENLPLDHENPSGGLSFNKMILVNPVGVSDHSFSPSTFQSSSICLSNNTPSDVCVVLVTSMYFIGMGNVSSFGMYSLTRGTT